MPKRAAPGIDGVNPPRAGVTVISPAPDEGIQTPATPFIAPSEEPMEAIDILRTYADSILTAVEDESEQRQGSAAWARDSLETLRSALQEASTQVETWAQAAHATLRNGPIPGAYFSFDLTAADSAGLSTGAGVAGQVCPVSFRPVFVSVFALGGQVRVDLNDDGGSILSGTISTSGGTGHVDKGGDFSTVNIERLSTLTLDIDTILSGTPTLVIATLWGKRAGQIEGI